MSQLTSVLTQMQQEYKSSFWSVLLHQIPHVNISFHRIHDDSFRPDSEVYLESLGIIGSVPAAWLIFTLFALLIYLLTRCCDTKNNKKRKSRPMRCCLSFFSLICCAGFGAGFWGNHLMHQEVDKFGYFLAQIAKLVDHAQNQAYQFDDLLSQDIRGNINTLYDGTFQSSIYQDPKAHDELLGYCDIVLYNITDGLKAMDEIRLKLLDRNQKPVSFVDLSNKLKKVEDIRWPLTLSLFAMCTLFCLLLFVGAIVNSRGTLIVFSVCGLLAIIVLWLLVSIYMTFSVAVADFCSNPNPWVMNTLMKNYNMSTEITNHYLNCSPTRTSPFHQGMEVSQQSVMTIGDYVKKISMIARRWYSDAQLNPNMDTLMQASQKTVQVMGELHNSLQCGPIYRNYNGALVSACEDGLFGLLLMVLSASVCACVLTALVWCNSHTWIYFKYKGKYIKVQDQDPYMPLSTIHRGRTSGMESSAAMYQRSRNVHTPPQTPPYHGTLNGHGTINVAARNGTEFKPMANPQPKLGFGHIGTLNRGVSLGQPDNMYHPGHGTLGRQPKPANSTYQTYGGSMGPGTTMTLGRKGHYASLKGGRAPESELPFLGPNQGQYATLSKGCKTLESSDFY